MKNCIIYTAISGTYDVLNKVDVNVRKIAFVDQIEPHRIMAGLFGWELVQITPTRRWWRDVKCNPQKYLPQHSTSIWIDGNIQATQKTVDRINDELRGNDIVLMEHNERSTLFDEINAVISLKKDHARNVIHLRRMYGNQPLFATGIIGRRNTGHINMFNELWWAEVCHQSHRDQLSIGFVLDRVGIIPGTIPFLHESTKHKHNQ